MTRGTALRLGSVIGLLAFMATATAEKASPPLEHPPAIAVESLPNDFKLSTVYNHLALQYNAPGDTIIPHYSITRDTVLIVSGYKVVAKRCGIGHFYTRLWFKRGPTDSVVVHADSVNLPICSSQWTPAGGSWSVQELPAGCVADSGSTATTPRITICLKQPGGARH